MRALPVVLGAIAMLVGVATQPASAGKGTDIEQFLKRIGKFAVADALDPKPRSLCVCQNGGGNHGRVGVLVHYGELGDEYVGVRCSVRSFYPSGQVAGAFGCDSFEVLSK